jgi:cellobiose phosphorylase
MTLLWLPYVTADYIQHTGDLSVLDEKTPFLEQERLSEEEDEKYAIPFVTENYASVYEHCVRAIDHSFKFGQHGIPLIGTGDWNDGFSAVGREGKGESVWLGWFLLSLLKKFIPICKERGDLERVQRYQEIIDTLANDMEKNAWDGSWYRRAYYDDGSPLGSITNTECQIDAIAQSWAVISESAKQTRVKDAMIAMERYLWDKDEALLKLFTPPFDKTEKNPGYIRGYIPESGENGGQYTHGAIWAIIAFAKMGKEIKPWNSSICSILSTIPEPIPKSRSTKRSLCDSGRCVYGPTQRRKRRVDLVYRCCGLDVSSGNRRNSGNQDRGREAEPIPLCTPSLAGVQVRLSLRSSRYSIQVKLQNTEHPSIVVDGTKIEEFPVILKDDGQNHSIEVVR